MPNKSGQYVYMEDGTVAQQVYAANAADVNSVTPVDIQSRLASTIQTHNGAVVTPSGSSFGSYASSWIDCDGFDKIAITVFNDASVNSDVQVIWSNDNANQHGVEALGVSNNRYRPHLTDIKSRYARLFISNPDAAPHTFNAWVMLKA